MILVQPDAYAQVAFPSLRLMDARRLIVGAAEIRAADDGEHLHAVLIQRARRFRGRKELFVPGSVQWPAEGVGILTAHRAAPEVRAVPTREADGRISIVARATDAIREAVQAGRTWMSVEFHALEERTVASGVREVLQAFVPRAALVRDPEYDVTGAELREAERRAHWRRIPWL